VTPPVGDYFSFSNDVVRSRGILLDTLHALEAQRESLTLIDRDVMHLDSFGLGAPIDAYVAELAALIAAKAWKLFDRLDPTELKRNAARLRPKDAGDLWRLLATSDPGAVRVTFEEGISHPRIGNAVAQAKLNLEFVLADSAFMGLAIAHFGGRFSDQRIEVVVTDWVAGFTS
jgi:hypothetical protein